MADMTEIEVALNNFELAARWVETSLYDKCDSETFNERLANRQSKREHLLELIKEVKDDN